ncbi:MAG: Stp1/IreP family PP2C-type Ser/Thr phosphatase [Clostridia bacterium]|nr:Stp1/IreP family PP2C-type Ser/Thr phosphatase [Clostridia bacterium]
MQIFACTDKGLKRETNQDAYFTGYLSDGSAVAIVCDGMGGARAGNIASTTATKMIFDYISNSYSNKLNREALMKLIRNAVLSANISIYNMSQKNEELNGMGTTVVVLVIRNGFAFICHAGDSRAYLINDKISQITKDHSVVQTLVEDGKLTPEEAKVHPKKNVITRALGVEESVIPDSYELPINIGDTILLCTDGLSNYVDESEIFSLISTKEDTTQKLIEKANSAGGGDNITAITVTL